MQQLGSIVIIIIIITTITIIKLTMKIMRMIRIDIIDVIYEIRAQNILGKIRRYRTFVCMARAIGT